MDDALNRSSDDLLKHTRKLLRRFKLRARKGLGQHFLVNADVLDTILQAADLSPRDTVIEVGPGLGILTDELAARCGWVIAIELDDALAGLLGTTLQHDNIVILNQDVLGTEPGRLFGEQSPHVPPEMSVYKVVANLPYYITSPVLRHFLEASVRPDVMVVMVQKEVAEAVTAAAGKRSLLSIAVQLYGKPEIVRIVPAASFYPAPEVDSAVVKIEVYDEPPVSVPDTDSFFRLVRAGFGTARKQLGNSLSHGLDLPKADVLTMLQSAGIDPRRRAETLEIAEWASLLEALNETEGE